MGTNDCEDLLSTSVDGPNDTKTAVPMCDNGKPITGTKSKKPRKKRKLTRTDQNRANRKDPGRKARENARLKMGNYLKLTLSLTKNFSVMFRL